LEKNHNNAQNRIPSDLLKRLGDKISSQTLEAWKRVEAALPYGVKAESALNASALSVTYTFTHEQMGELGRIDARFTGDNFSLNQLYCGIRGDDDDFREARKTMMTGIYENAMAVFSEARQPEA
jgi:hypothetical protein